MTQLSRPYQVALVAIGLLAAVWFVALRGSSASTGGSGSSGSAPSASSPAAKPAAPSPVYHGSAPGVEGLTRAINKARGAVAQSQQNARQLQEKSAQASSPTSKGAAVGTSTAGAQATSSVKSKGSATIQKTAPSGAGAPRASRSKIAASPSMQVTVERELKQGKVVAILFWNPAASVDQTVRRELQAVGQALGAKIAVHDAHANQVGSFGSFTRAVQVYQTPTILIVNKRGQASALTGLTDAFSIEQAIGEVKR